MARTTNTHLGLSPFIMASTVLVWISAVIVMGILSYFLSKNKHQGDHIIYEEVIVCSQSKPRSPFSRTSWLRFHLLTHIISL